MGQATKFGLGCKVSKLVRALSIGVAVIVAVIAGAAPRSARAACATPVLANCQNPSYLASACGLETRPACELLLHAAATTLSTKVTKTKQALLPRDLARAGALATKQGISDVVETAWVVPDSHSLQYGRGTTAHYAGVVQSGALAALSRTSFLPQTFVERASNGFAQSTQISPGLFPGPNGVPGQGGNNGPPPVPVGNIPGLPNAALLGGGNVLQRFDNGALGTIAGILSQVVDKRVRWKSDGPRVGSCEEYVYQRYTTFSAFEDAAQQLGNDYPAIFDLAYLGGTPGGGRPPLGGGVGPLITDASLANKHIRDELGNIVTEITFPKFTSRNAYYEWKPGNPGDTRYPISATTRYWDTIPARVAELGTLLFDTNPWSWSWAEFRNVGTEYLAKYNPDLLEELDGRKFDFEQLLARRRALMAAYDSAALAAVFKNVTCRNDVDPGHKLHGYDCGFGFDRSFLAPLDEEFGARLSELDALIDAAFAHAPDGCVHDRFTHVRNACDWSPHEFYRFLVDQMNIKRERDYGSCIAVTANNFSVKGRLQEIKLAGLPAADIAPGDWNASSAKLTELIDKFRAYAAKLRRDLPISGGVAKGVPPTFGDEESDAESTGNGTFGAGYDYDIGWTVDGLGSDGRLTDLTVAAHAKFTSSITLLGVGIPVIDALASIAPNPGDEDKFDEKLHFKVLDTDIYLPAVDDTTAEPVFNLTLTETAAPDLPQYPAVVLVMGIPIKFVVGAAGSASFTVGMHGELARHHDADPAKETIGFTVGGGATPKMVLNGFASASIDLVIVEVGIKGELTILNVELPLTMDLSIKNDDKGQPILQGNSALNAVLRSLDGRLALFVKVFLLGSVEQNLISWHGPGINQPLFTNTFGPLPLADVQKALNSAL